MVVVKRCEVTDFLFIFGEYYLKFCFHRRDLPTPMVNKPHQAHGKTKYLLECVSQLLCVLKDGNGQSDSSTDSAEDFHNGRDVQSIQQEGVSESKCSMQTRERFKLDWEQTADDGDRSIAKDARSSCALHGNSGLHHAISSLHHGDSSRLWVKYS